MEWTWSTQGPAFTAARALRTKCSTALAAAPLLLLGQKEHIAECIASEGAKAYKNIARRTHTKSITYTRQIIILLYGQMEKRLVWYSRAELCDLPSLSLNL
jgi:hypothetical protein